MHYFISFIVTIALVAPGLCAQEQLNSPTKKTMDVRKTAITPQLDGLIEDHEWSDATVISDIYQITPNEYAPPSEKTEFLLKYDHDYLYIAAKAYQSNPEDIVARVSRQGADTDNDDAIQVFIDPYNSKRSGYEFSLNLNGVRNEAIFLNITNLSEDWTGVWNGKAKETDYGWSAEIAIPFKTLTFDPNSDTWGVNLYRYMASTNEKVGWVSQNRSTNASVSGDAVGFLDINQGLGLDIIPSLSTIGSREFSDDQDDFRTEPSIDIFYKITPSLNGSLTVNTDFSATEVDDQQVNLSQFNLFFPEKRSFFLREFDIFEFGGIGNGFPNANFSNPEAQNARPFFSRTIGLSSSGEPVDIDVGAKVSGRINQFEVGTLAVRQGEFVAPDVSDSVAASDLFVGRVAADFLAESSIGAIFTSGDPQSNLDNNLYGFDFRYRNSRLGAGKRIDANVWYQQTNTEGVDSRDTAYGAMFSMPNSDRWAAIVQYQRVNENFNPALGFVSRTGVDLKRGAVGYTSRFRNHRWLRTIHSGVDIRRWDWLDERGIQTGEYRLTPFTISTQAGDFLRPIVARFVEGIYEGGRQPLSNVGITLPLARHEWDRYGAFFQSSQNRPVDIKLVYFAGEFYTGDRVSGEIGLGWRASSKFQISGSYSLWDVELPEGEFMFREIDARTEWAFSSTLSWVNVVQYNNISATIGINSRLHWTPRAGQDVFLVVNHNYDELDDGDFVSRSTDATIKASYTFRF